ncbi:MAG: hypothetical protein ABEI98_04810, partial [Halorhabdus sp.]
MSSVPVAWVLGLASATGQVQQIIQTILRAIQGGPNAPSPSIVVGGVVGVALLLLGIGIIASRRLVGSTQQPSTNATDDPHGTGGGSGPLNRLLSRLPGGFGSSTPGDGGSARTDPDNVDLEEIDDETFDRAVSILEQEGRETSRANIREQIARLIDFEAADPDEFRLGFIQDADSQAQLDQASVAPPSIVPEDPTTLYRNSEFVRILTPASAPESVFGGWLI